MRPPKFRSFHDTYWVGTNPKVLDERRGPFGTRAQAVQYGPGVLGLKPGGTFWTGHAVSDFLDEVMKLDGVADFVIDLIDASLYPVGGSDPWPAQKDMTVEDKVNLEKEIAKVVSAFLKRSGFYPTTFILEEIMEHEVPHV